MGTGGGNSALVLPASWSCPDPYSDAAQENRVEGEKCPLEDSVAISLGTGDFGDISSYPTSQEG